MEFRTDTPTASALYLVDRGAQGKYYRYFDAETGTWSRCGINFAEAMENKDKPSPVGFFPWVGPLTGPNFMVNKAPTPEPVKVAKLTKAAKAADKRILKAVTKPKAKLVVTQVGNTKVGSIVKTSGKVVHPDGTVFYRADRQKWVAVWAGKQEAARPTAEACLAFLKKKYNHDGVVLVKGE